LENVEKKAGASNTMAACAQKKGETMKLFILFRQGGGLEEALRIITAK